MVAPWGCRDHYASASSFGSIRRIRKATSGFGGQGTAGNLAPFVGMPSTVIQSFAYDPGKRELRVVFTSGRGYVYEGVPEDIYTAMRRSFSKGEYFNEHIRDRYAFRREPS